MDISKMIAELRVQLDQLNRAIIVLEQLAVTRGSKRRGRPPAWMAAAKNADAAPLAKRRGRPPGSKNRKK